ncbi:MAG TPA: nitroreductase family protein [Acidimicrobiales bacterium]|nr:nitroreductase family protein [Acidimicrobiales bacterium]
MELSAAIRSRRMIRHFTSEPVDDGARERIIAAGLRAPSAGFSQGCELLVLETEQDRVRLWAAHQPTERASWSAEVAAAVRRAPLLVMVLTSRERYLDRYAEPDKGWIDRDEARWPVPYWFVDAGCVVMLLLLAAVDEGLGALLFGTGPGDAERLRAAFGIPDGYDIVGTVAIGHPDPTAARRNLTGRRRPSREVVHRGRFAGSGPDVTHPRPS